MSSICLSPRDVFHATMTVHHIEPPNLAAWKGPLCRAPVATLLSPRAIIKVDNGPLKTHLFPTSYFQGVTNGPPDTAYRSPLDTHWKC